MLNIAHMAEGISLGAAMAYGLGAWRPVDRDVSLFMCGIWLLSFGLIVSVNL
jgi:hypothetical protein